MNEALFNKTKKELMDLIHSYLNENNTTRTNKIEFTKILEILNQYTFENRLQKKGLLSHTIIDSLELDYYIGEKFIIFDNNID